MQLELEAAQRTELEALCPEHAGGTSTPSSAIAADASEPTGTAAEAAMYDPLLADADDEAPTPAPTPAGFSGSDLAGGQHPQRNLAGSFAVYTVARCRARLTKQHSNADNAFPCVYG